ncbi:hypothetical protein G6F40_014024 [Rhizopus arrhizus]|nr:hypothetical protein G6F40_014024 [Rhizopus arrhizus]
MTDQKSPAQAAMQEAERNATAHDYFEARREIDSAEARRVFEAGFDRAYASRPKQARDAEKLPPLQWLTSVAQMKVLAAELTRAAETMGGDDEESADVELILSAAKPGTVQDDDGESNTTPILTVHLAEYPEEGVYPIDPCDPTGGRVDVAAPAAGDALDVLILTHALQDLRQAFVIAVGDKSPFARIALEKAESASAQQSQRKEA